MRAKDFRVPLAEHFHLTDEEMNAWYPSGNGEIFLDRISWALSYLFIAGLVEKPKRGDYKISDKGLSMLESCSDEQISEYIKTTVNARTPKKESKGEFYQFNLSSCIRQQNSLTAQFVSFSLANLANIFYPPNFYNN